MNLTNLTLKRFHSCPCCESSDLNPLIKHTNEYRPPSNWKEFFYGGQELLGPITQCGNCGFHFLESPSPQADHFYNNAEVTDYMDMETSRLNYFKKVKKLALKEAPESSKSHIKIDIGSASGSWLNQWRSTSKRVGVELNEKFRPIHEQRGLSMERSLDSIHIDGSALITAFDFLEHVEDPLGFLDGISRLPHHNENFYILGVPDMGRIWAKIMGSNYYLYCPMHFNYFTPKSLQIMCEKVFHEHKISIIKSPTMQSNLNGILKWTFPSMNVGKIGNLHIPIGYRSNILAIISPKND